MRLSIVRSARKSLFAPSRAYQTALVVPLLQLCIVQAQGQFVFKPPTVSAPVIQSVPGTCADTIDALSAVSAIPAPLVDNYPQFSETSIPAGCDAIPRSSRVHPSVFRRRDGSPRTSRTEGQ